MRENGIGTGNGSLRQRTHRWVRWAHVYVSMFALMLILLFGLTGLTLNHPEWSLGANGSTVNVIGTVPASALGSGGAVEFLSISEFVRSEYGVSGRIADFGTDASGAYITYRGPGYGADLTFDPTTGAYSLVLDDRGWLGAVNDLHRGRSAGGAWAWTIDFSAILLITLAVTGLVLELFVRRRRRTALIVAAIGSIVTVALIAVAVS